MQKLAKSSSLQIYYEDLVYLESTLSADEENTTLSTLAKTAKTSKEDVIKLQEEERLLVEKVIFTRARRVLRDEIFDREILDAELTLEQVTKRDRKHPDYTLVFSKHSASELVGIGITRQNSEMRLLLARAKNLAEAHPFRVRHESALTLKLDKSEQADALYQKAKEALDLFYARAGRVKVEINKTRRELYLDISKLYPHDKDLVEAYFRKIEASDSGEEDVVEENKG